MHVFDALGDPVRRRITELLADGELPAGEITSGIRSEFGISQPAVSQHLRVLRQRGLVAVRPEGTRRFYSIRLEALAEVSAWLQRFSAVPGPALAPQLDALGTEIARGVRSRRLAAEAGQPSRPTSKEQAS